MKRMIDRPVSFDEWPCMEFHRRGGDLEDLGFTSVRLHKRGEGRYILAFGDGEEQWFSTEMKVHELGAITAWIESQIHDELLLVADRAYARIAELRKG